jgi:hypothetical protein
MICSGREASARLSLPRTLAASRDERTNSARMLAVPEDACLHLSKRTNMGEAYAKIQAARHGEVWGELTPTQI